MLPSLLDNFIFVM